MVSRAKKAARAAAKRIPIVGTAVILAPIARSASNAGLNLSTIGNMEVWKNFFTQLQLSFTDTGRIAETYTPIAVYIVARRFAGKHISRILRPLGVKF